MHKSAVTAVSFSYDGKRSTAGESRGKCESFRTKERPPGVDSQRETQNYFNAFLTPTCSVPISLPIPQCALRLHPSNESVTLNTHVHVWNVVNPGQKNPSKFPVRVLVG